MGHRNNWFATPEGAALVDEEGSPHTSNCGTGRCQKSRVSSVCVAGVTRIWKIWWWLDIVLRLPPAAATADDEIGGLPPLPTCVFLSFFLPGTGIGIGSDEVPIPLTARPLIDDLLSPLTQSSAKNHRYHPRPRTYNHGILHRPTQPHTPGRNTIKTVLSPLQRDLVKIVVPIPTEFGFLARQVIYRTVLGSPSTWKVNYLRRPSRCLRGDICY